MTATLYIVTRNGKILPELTANSERYAWEGLGRWLVTTDVVLSGPTCADIGRAACQPNNPFRVQAITVTLPQP